MGAVNEWKAVAENIILLRTKGTHQSNSPLKTVQPTPGLKQGTTFSAVRQALVLIRVASIGPNSIGFVR
jgi:hypothetical protein